MLSPFSTKPLNPSISSFQWISPNTLSFPSSKTYTTKFPSPQNPKFLPIQSFHKPPTFPLSLNRRNPTLVSAGRSNKKPGGPSTGRLEGGSEIRREAKKNAKRRSRRLAENLFYRLKNPNKNQADNFTEDELQMIGLGYDRMVRFMEKDDPNLKHPYDWYKYGQFGPYSWRGVVIGDPIRGRFSDERVSMIGSVRDHEEWEEIEQFEMTKEFGNRLNTLDKEKGLNEIVVESGNKRLDKWNLMGRLGNKVRAMITQCAAWMRPDIIYVKRPVYQCRFEPQEDFFKAMGPLLDPSTEQNFLFELQREDGTIETCTYFGGLCKIVKANPKAFVDDVVKENEKYWEDEFQKALRSSEAMEGLVKRSVEKSTALYKRQLKEMEEKNHKEVKEPNVEVIEDSEERIRPKMYKDEWDYVGYGRKRRRKTGKNRIPPELFLRGAVRPFTYRNLVKEIVLMRHAIIDGDISGQS
ncbi:hypothetical protein IFM89_037576 [Coptis chinensis]|uniref:Uncharacterized protein n=1 Tax=Coptis chinensis TaxID=261450 RepID=A0A835LQI2_9MAGN|nr:hypothetical protein IFM89_037576 [Coptis chinensis]